MVTRVDNDDMRLQEVESDRDKTHLQEVEAELAEVKQQLAELSRRRIRLEEERAHLVESIDVRDRHSATRDAARRWDRSGIFTVPECYADKCLQFRHHGKMLALAHKLEYAYIEELPKITNFTGMCYVYQIFHGANDWTSYVIQFLELRHTDRYS